MFSSKGNRTVWLLIFLVVRSAQGGTSSTKTNRLEKQEPHNLLKRGYSSSGHNDYGPPLHVSSSVLQLSSPPEEHNAHYEHNDGWQPSAHPLPGYEIWLQPADHVLAPDDQLHEYHHRQQQPYPILVDHKPIVIEHKPSVFSADVHPIHSILGSPPDSGLHTHIHSSIEPTIVQVSDNVDFHNVADELKVQVAHHKGPLRR